MHLYKIRTYGCQMNVYDENRLKTALSSMGFEEDEKNPDVVIFLTCSIRDKAEHKVLSELGLYKPALQEKPPLVAVLGCMAQRRGRELHARYPWVRIMSGPRHLGAVPGAILDCLNAADKKKTRYLLDDDAVSLCDLNYPPKASVRSFITIAHGCDHFCSYCIVPYVRGRFQSRNADDIIKEAQYLVQNGVREIILLGQNVNRYGKDIGTDFASLLVRAAEIPGILRIRYTTNHPVDFDERLIEAMSGNKKICPAVNLPVQSGSDKILKLMKRGYTAEKYENLIGNLRNAVPDIAITSDLIVGFPGETEDDFNCSVELLKRVRFDMVHTAVYSLRPGTAAEKMEGHLDSKTKSRRLNFINSVQNEISREINEKYVGNTYEVLIDGNCPTSAGLQGRTMSDKVVIFPENFTAKEGDIVQAEIKRASTWYLYA